MNSELKPCPCCQAPAVPPDHADAPIYCSKCGLRALDAERWNTRQLSAEIAALKHDLERHISIANEQAGEITQLSADLEAAKQALNRCHERFVDYEKLHAAKGTVDGYAKADRNREMADMCASTLERLSKAGDPARP